MAKKNWEVQAIGTRHMPYGILLIIAIYLLQYNDIFLFSLNCNSIGTNEFLSGLVNTEYR